MTIFLMISDSDEQAGNDGNDIEHDFESCEFLAEDGVGEHDCEHWG